jgi:uncharacterized protein
MSTITSNRCAWLAAGAILLGLLAPSAIAGPAEDNVQAEKEFARGNLVVAVELWKKAAASGYAPAQVWLGDILDKSEEDEEAVAWYRKAVAQGDAAGEFGLGQMYAKGEGVKKDFVQAVALVKRSAEKNHLPAIAALRDIYKYGRFGVAIDLAESDIWDAKAKALSPKPDPAKDKPTAKQEKK